MLIKFPKILKFLYIFEFFKTHFNCIKTLHIFMRKYLVVFRFNILIKILSFHA